MSVFRNAQQLLLSSAVDVQDKARLLAVAEKEAGSWLEVLPAPSLGLHLSNNELRIVVSLVSPLVSNTPVSAMREWGF